MLPEGLVLENEGLRKRISDLEVQIDELEGTEPPYQHEINTGAGYIKWDSDNLQLQDLMERLEEKLKTTAPNNIQF